MKKFTFLSLLFIGFLLQAQCTITGKSTIILNTEEIFSVANETAQCKDCHLWADGQGNATISSDNRQNTVKIIANTVGRQVLSVSILTPTGLVQCSKNIEVLEGAAALDQGENLPNVYEKKVDCDILTKDLKEVKYSENMVSFFPIGDDNALRYIWTATYWDGREVIFKEKVAQFTYSKTDGIKSIKVQMISNSCIKTLSKTYDHNYWEFFK